MKMWVRRSSRLKTQHIAARFGRLFAVGIITLMSAVSPLIMYTQTAGAVTSTGGKWDSIDAGANYNCAISRGSVYCWGFNDYWGNLGDGTYDDRMTPKMVGGGLIGKTVTKLAAGRSSVCAISDGALYCWGSNRDGQIGDGTYDDALMPVRVLGALAGKQVTDVAVGGYSACAVADGEAYCWGSNSYYGQLGDGTRNDSTVPLKVFQGIGVLAGKIAQKVVVGDEYACALADSEAYCWGTNEYGELGDGTMVDSGVPVKVKQASGLLAGKELTDIKAGALHVCVVAAGAAYCWGENSNGPVGNGTNTARAEPAKVNGLLVGKTITKISAGDYGTCATANNEAYCWGYNGDGQLADGTHSDRNVPVKVTGLPSVSNLSDISMGEYWDSVHACAIGDGKIYCWGGNDYGELGYQSDYVGNSTTPLEISSTAKSMFGGITITSLTAGADHTCAIAGSEAYCWGRNNVGQLGDGTTESSQIPIKVAGLLSGKTVTAISAGNEHTCALTDGEVYCWGRNYNGQVGDTVNTQHYSPFKVTGALSGKTVSAISAGDSGTCAITSGDLYCWGADYYGSLGIAPMQSDYSTPTLVTAYTGKTITAVSTGYQRTCVIAGGEAYCTGSTTIYDGSGTVRKMAGTLAGKTVTSIDAGANHSCAVADSEAYCWGSNSNGELGDGTTTNSSNPVKVSGLTGKTIQNISAGDMQYYSSSCAAADDGTYCWGTNFYGEMGNGTTSASQLSAVQVSGLASGTGTTSLEGGMYHFCELNTGKIYCWGYNASEVFTYPGKPYSLVPVLLDYTLPDVNDLSDQMSTPLTKRPTFTGVAEPGSTIVVTVHSDPVTCTTTADSNGNWSCTLPSDLPSGAHTVNVVVTTLDGDVINLGPYNVNVAAGSTLKGNINSPNTGGGTTLSLLAVVGIILVICATIFLLLPKRVRG